MAEVLGVIRDPRVGLRDVDRPVLWFEAQEIDCSSLQVLNWEQAGRLLLDAGVSELKYLEGMAIALERSSGSSLPSCGEAMIRRLWRRALERLVRWWDDRYSPGWDDDWGDQ